MIDVWINKGSGWNVESIQSQYINISTYRPLLGSSYISLPEKLRSPKKGLLNIKNKNQTCFLWCYVRHINPSKENPERIRKIDKKLIPNPEQTIEKILLVILIMMALSFLSKKKILTRLR